MRLRTVVINGLIAIVLAVLAIDTLPQVPAAVHDALRPWLIRLGVDQGAWNLFAPEPDRLNMRLSAEVTYRDGEKRTWRGPVWKDASAWQKWVGHRHLEWFDHITAQTSQPVWEPWCRHLARQARPDFPEADRGALVRVLYHEAEIPPAEIHPWPSMRDAMAFDEGWVLTIEEL